MAGTASGVWSKYWTSGTMVTRLIVVNVLVWLGVITLSIVARFFLPFLLSASGQTWYLAAPAEIGKVLTRPWTILTHMFTHKGFFHILFNMWLLYILGNVYQSYFGPKKVLSTYLLGGLAGFLAFFLLYNGSGALQAQGVTAIGASAAVMAIFVATATYFPDMSFRLLLIGDVKLKYLAIAYVLFDFVALNGVSNVGGHAGHLGGALYGFFFVQQLKRGRDMNTWLEKLIDRLVVVFKPGTRLKVTYKKSGPTKRRKSDEEFNAEKKKRQERVDQILDKISRAGYDSLTKEEKDFLFRHSKDL